MRVPELHGLLIGYKAQWVGINFNFFSWTLWRNINNNSSAMQELDVSSVLNETSTYLTIFPKPWIKNLAFSSLSLLKSVREKDSDFHSRGWYKPLLQPLQVEDAFSTSCHDRYENIWSNATLGNPLQSSAMDTSIFCYFFGYIFNEILTRPRSWRQRLLKFALYDSHPIHEIICHEPTSTN